MKFKYPCFVRHHELIVRADKQTGDKTFSGEVIKSNEYIFPNHPVGKYKEDWEISDFETYEEGV